MASETPTRFYQGRPPTTEALLYEVPQGATTTSDVWTAHLRQVIATNTSKTTAATFTLSLVPDGEEAGLDNRLVANVAVPPGDIRVIDMNQPAFTGEQLVGSQDIEGAIALTIAGVI